MHIECVRTHGNTIASLAHCWQIQFVCSNASALPSMRTFRRTKQIPLDRCVDKAVASMCQFIVQQIGFPMRLPLAHKMKTFSSHISLHKPYPLSTQPSDCMLYWIFSYGFSFINQCVFPVSFFLYIHAPHLSSPPPVSQHTSHNSCIQNNSCFLLCCACFLVVAVFVVAMIGQRNIAW